MNFSYITNKNFGEKGQKEPLSPSEVDDSFCRKLVFIESLRYARLSGMVLIV